MSELVIIFNDEIKSAPMLLNNTKDKELWVLGGLGDFPPEKTGAEKIREVIFQYEEALKEPLSCAQAVYELFGEQVPELIVTMHGIRGDALAAELSNLLDCELILGAESIVPENKGWKVEKNVFAGNLKGKFICKNPQLAISLQPGGSVIDCLCKTPLVEAVETPVVLPEFLISPEFYQVKEEASIQDAKVVIAAGRGTGSADNFRLMEELAESLGGLMGGSRPTVCDGKVPASRLIGVSGSRINPELCITMGASGAAAFISGIENSKTIIAVNKDPNARIFEYADYGVKADAAGFAKALLEVLNRDE